MTCCGRRPGRSTLRYQAGEYSIGTDDFQFRVVDDLGAAWFEAELAEVLPAA